MARPYRKHSRKPHARKFSTTIRMGASHNEVVSVEHLPDGRVVPALVLHLNEFEGKRRDRDWHRARHQIADTLCIMHNIMPREVSYA